MHAYYVDERLVEVAVCYGIMDTAMPPFPMTVHQLLSFNLGGAEITGDAEGLNAPVIATAMTEGGRRLGKGPGRIVFVYMITGAMNRVLGLDPTTLVRPRAIEAGESAVIDRLLPELVRVRNDRRAIAETIDAHFRAAFDNAPPPDAADAALALIACEAETSVPAMANRLGISQRTLQRRFRNRFGCSPSRYLRHLRLIRSHPGSLRDIAWSHVPPELDYFDQPHWLRDLREIYGTNPTELQGHQQADWQPYPPGCFDPDGAVSQDWQGAYFARMRALWIGRRRELVAGLANHGSGSGSI